MKEDTLRVIIAIGFLIQIIGFIGFSLLMLSNMVSTSGMMDTIVIEFGQSFKEVDRRMFSLNNRMLVLEEQRDLEARVTNLEKAARIYCTGTKTEMCGSLDVTR